MAPYNGLVIDQHHHILLRKDLPCLGDPTDPSHFGDYFALRRDYTVEKWINDIAPEDVVKSVDFTATWAIQLALHVGASAGPVIAGDDDKFRAVVITELSAFADDDSRG